jgi:hypothetical protein
VVSSTGSRAPWWCDQISGQIECSCVLAYFVLIVYLIESKDLSVFEREIGSNLFLNDFGG